MSEPKHLNSALIRISEEVWFSANLKLSQYAVAEPAKKCFGLLLLLGLGLA